MATILLSSVGSLFGPFGQIAGTLAGSAIDHALFGPQDRHGPRLKELAVTGSSYGTPIARHYGTMRSGGSIVWAADLTEHREREGGGKGQPRTVRYSYSASFAVALSSRPIDRIGRIWAGGSLLRGKAGDLKAAGQLRVHTGHGDQPCDPLMEAALGAQCPAFRGTAYAVFEDLDLTDFGNRIPPLSFEIFAGDGSRMVELLLEDCWTGSAKGVRLDELRGFAHESGSVREVLQLVDRLWPLSLDTLTEGLQLRLASSPHGPAIALPPAVRWEGGEFGRLDGTSLSRPTGSGGQTAALRYYDAARDFQPGLQYAGPLGASSRTLEFPGVLGAGDALALARAAHVRGKTAGERLHWRCSTLGRGLAPGGIVTAPGHPGLYQIVAREWRVGGVELDLVRHRPSAPLPDQAADPGSPWSPPDRLASRTSLRVFEIPWHGIGAPDTRVILAAPSAPAGRWPGCTLYAVDQGRMVPLDTAAQERAIGGQLMTPLGASRAIRFEPGASLLVQLIDHDAVLASTDLRGIARHENLLLVGDEVMQFAQAVPLGAGQWKLTGLLRGRGGTEREAAIGHGSGAAVTLLDDRLVPLASGMLFDPGTRQFAAIGAADEEPALAALENPGASLRPLAPVHPRALVRADGSLLLSWTRRARGQWGWSDHVDVPLVEETEGYEISFGPQDAAIGHWQTTRPQLALSAGEWNALAAAAPEGIFQVRQIGTHDRSPPLHFAALG